MLRGNYKECLRLGRGVLSGGLVAASGVKLSAAQELEGLGGSYLEGFRV